jgi:hypothetical protein
MACKFEYKNIEFNSEEDLRQFIIDVKAGKIKLTSRTSILKEMGIHKATYISSDAVEIARAKCDKYNKANKTDYTLNVIRADKSYSYNIDTITDKNFGKPKAAFSNYKSYDEIKKLQQQQVFDRISKESNTYVNEDGDVVNKDDLKYPKIDNDNNKLFQNSGSLSTLSQSKINNLQNTIEYQLLNEKDEDLNKKVGQSYIFLSEKDAERFSNIVEKSKQFPKEFKVTKKITKYEKDLDKKLKYNSYNEYVDFYYIKSNNNKKSNLYDIVNKETGELISSKVRVLSISKDSKSEIAQKYGLEHTPTKIFNANRSIAFSLYRQKPSKAKYIAQAKKYLYDAIKFLNPEETSLNINLDKIEELLNNFPNEMWDYINTTYSPEDSTNINASISLQNEIKFNLPKLGLLLEIEKITGISLRGISFINHDRTGRLAKIFKYSKLNGEWGDEITIDNSTMTTKELKASIRYYLRSKNYFKPSSAEQNVRKYAEHKNIDYDELRKLVFGDFDNALNNISYNTSGNSDTIELSKWRESIREYDWQSVELFLKPYENFQNTVKERIINKFKDKKLSNDISHLDYFFNTGAFNWLNINFNNISGKYYTSDMETETNVGVETEMGGIINPFEMKIYNKPVPGKNFLQEKEVFNRLAAILHEPFHALHALSYGTKEEFELRKAFNKLYDTDFGKELMNQVFGSGYNNQNISYETLYKEFTAFTTQLMLYPKQWIRNTDLRSNDIYDFILKIQTLQDKTYDEIIKTQQKIGIIEKTITEEEQIKLLFLEKLYNYIVNALYNIIPLSKKFISVIADSKLVDKQVIEDVFGTVEETVTKRLKLPDNVKKSKDEFLQSMEELQSAINTLMQIDGKLFSSNNIINFFVDDSYNQESNEQVLPQLKEGVSELFESNPELATIGTQEQYSQYLETIFPDSKVKEMDNSLYISVLNQLEQENKIEKDCTGGGKLKAKDGITTLFEKGGKWELVTDFKNAPTHKAGGKDIFIQGKKVEIEKNELRIENDFGDVAVIPSKYRVEVKDAIKSNCHSCIDNIVESLPKMKDYAGDGTVFPFFGRYKRFKNSLPDNLKNTSEDDYAMRYYWKHNNKPKSFDEAINREQSMFTMEDDGYYHAPSVEPNTLRFLKPKNHPTLQYELNWYNSDNPDAVDFKSKYDLDTSGKFYKYVPKKK